MKLGGVHELQGRGNLTFTRNARPSVFLPWIFVTKHPMTCSGVKLALFSKQNCHLCPRPAESRIELHRLQNVPDVLRVQVTKKAEPHVDLPKGKYFPGIEDRSRTMPYLIDKLRRKLCPDLRKNSPNRFLH